MGLQGYVGSAADQARIRQLEQAREEEQHRLEEAKKAAAAQPKSFRQWEHGTAEVLENAFKKETVGLVSREEYVEKKSSIQARLEDEARKRKRQAEAEVEMQRNAKLAVNAQARKTAKLSFLQDDEDDTEDADWRCAEGAAVKGTAPAQVPAVTELGSTGSAGTATDAATAHDKHPRGAASPPRPLRVRKNDEVATSFLPDAQRQREKEDLRAQLKQQWLHEQEALKERALPLKFSYWDGSGHQRTASVRVGDTIATFLKAAKGVLEKDFPQLRHATVPNLLLVKDGVLLPQSMTFYTCVVGKVHDGRGVQLFDPHTPVDAQKVHACKVVQRSWYESNKHIYPASRWEPYSDATHIAL